MQLHRLGPVGNTDTTARFLTSFWDANVTASFSAADGFFGGPRAGADIPLAARVVAPAHRPAGGSISLVDATLLTVSQSRAILSEKRESPKPPRQHEMKKTRKEALHPHTRTQDIYYTSFSQYVYTQYICLILTGYMYEYIKY